MDVPSLNEEWVNLGRAWACRAGASIPGAPSSSSPYDGSPEVTARLPAAPTQVDTPEPGTQRTPRLRGGWPLGVLKAPCLPASLLFTSPGSALMSLPPGRSP